MDILNYLAIISCYTAGCLVAYRLGHHRGWSKGLDYAVTLTVQRLAAHGLNAEEIKQLLKANAG